MRVALCSSLFSIEQKGEIMILNPIIPVWGMGIICVLLLCFKRKGICSYIRQILIVVLLFVINLRIMVSGKDVTSVSKNVDILFVVDNTISMLAEDGKDDARRIDAVKEDCGYIMEQFPGASFSVVTFDNSVRVRTPYTMDTNMVLESIETLNGLSKYNANGTSMNDVMSQMKDILDNERENYKILFFISVGEIVNSEELKSYSELKEYVDDGAVLGYGTAEGGAMRAQNFVGEEEAPEYVYYMDEDYNDVKAISKIDEDNLKQIASDFDIEYIHMTGQSQIHEKLEKLQDEVRRQTANETQNKKTGYAETYYFFVIPLVFLLILDFVHYKRKR